MFFDDDDGDDEHKLGSRLPEFLRVCVKEREKKSERERGSQSQSKVLILKIYRVKQRMVLYISIT